MNGDRAKLAAAFRAFMHSAMRERGEPGAIVIDCTARPSGSIVVRIGDEDTQRALGDEPLSEATFDEFRGGMGLALPLARRIIAAHGGTIWSAPAAKPGAGAAVRMPTSS